MNKPKFKVGDLVYCDGVLGRVTDINEELSEITIGGGWIVYCDGDVTIRRADHRDITKIIKGTTP